MQAGAVSTCRSRPSAVTQPANKQKKIPFETGYQCWLASLHHWHALQARRTFSAAGVECKLNRAALGVNFTCISVAISACGTWPPAGTGAVREGGAMALSPELLMQHSLSQPSPAWSPARLPFILPPRHTPPCLASRTRSLAIGVLILNSFPSVPASLWLGGNEALSRIGLKCSPPRKFLCMWPGNCV